MSESTIERVARAIIENPPTKTTNITKVETAFAPVMFIVLGLGFVLWLASSAFAQTESEYRARFCAGMERERRLPNDTRVDCLTDRLAIEVDWTENCF